MLTTKLPFLTKWTYYWVYWLSILHFDSRITLYRYMILILFVTLYISNFMFFWIHCKWWIFWDSDEKIICRFEKTIFLRKLYWSHSLFFVYCYVIQLRYFWQNDFLNKYKFLDSLLKKVWWCTSSLISNNIISSECSYLPSYL